MNHVRTHWKLMVICVLVGCVFMLIAGFMISTVVGLKTDSSDWEDWFEEEVDPDVNDDVVPSESVTEVESEESFQDHAMYIDVKGAVRRPGVYRLDHGSRVLDAVMEAGGFIDDAAHDGINLAQKLHDEMVVFVPYLYHDEGVESVPFAADWTVDQEDTEEGVCLNSSDQSELETLPGIGPAKAAAIITHREQVGAFKTAEDLKAVPGIGDKTFSTLEPFIKITPGTSP